MSRPANHDDIELTDADMEKLGRVGRPTDPEDMEKVNRAIIEAKRLASIARGRVSGSMNPKGLEWHEASELAGATETLAYHCRWMLNRLRELEAGIPSPATRLREALARKRLGDPPP